MKHLKTTIVLLALAMSTTACYKNRTCTCKGAKVPGAPVTTIYSESFTSDKNMAETTCNSVKTVKQADYYNVECTLD